MNKPIRTISIFCMLLFLALMLNATVLQYVRASGLNDDPRNRRVLDAAFSRERGSIVVGQDAVARSVPSGDEYEFQRTYPQPFKYAPVTGYFSFDSTTGLERTQNEVLSGEDPRLFTTRLVDLLNGSQPKGGRINLTLDPKAQTAAYDALISRFGPNVEASAVALEPATGRVLAMVSLPSYDPNRLASHDYAKVQRAYGQLESNESQPMLNRATQTRLPPGSTFKIVTAAAALESGNYEGAEALVPGGSTYQLPLSSSVIDNGGRSCGSGRIPLRQALEQSCNTTFLALADELGNDAMAAQAEKFGFNSNDWFDDLPRLAESVYPTDADRPQTALTGIGQFNVAATPLQMAMVVAGVANDGVVKQPYLVDEVVSPDLEVIDKTDDTTLSEAVSPETADTLTDILVSTVDSGTASPAAIPGVRVAGKTGTAENCDDCSNYAWFVSFAPADDPQVAVAVMIQKADVPPDDIAGGQLGGPVAKAIMEAVIQR
ncbi:penicillin-binding protein 2 [Nocardioides rotundus]|uniref:peptidoglycan D,D-transpeptidase FtsI family protein n=1 Tax=Nocardioides rotundus TaxID=1774216 RepID=UPI001CBB0EDB|nr:penicillin-binding protein 2 [Nocardioides rotundus]UAL30021.1 penicillin-binding protein 2 [Nocardioides rotundus]